MHTHLHALLQGVLRVLVRLAEGEAERGDDDVEVGQVHVTLAQAAESVHQELQGPSGAHARLHTHESNRLSHKPKEGRITETQAPKRRIQVRTEHEREGYVHAVPHKHTCTHLEVVSCGGEGAGKVGKDGIQYTASLHSLG